jgi:small subunit ribosomal protein S9
MVDQKSKKTDYIYAVGRRKRSSATIRLFSGDGDWIVNGKLIGDYFSGQFKELEYMSPFRALNLAGKYFGTIMVRGGGVSGQLGAVRLAISRALLDIDGSHRQILRKRGLLTRDPREKERKKYNLHKARRAHQFSKR